MSVPSKLIAFAVVLGVAFGAAALAGAQLGPTSPPAPVSSCGSAGESAGGALAGPGQAASGLAVSDGSYTLQPEVVSLHPGVPARFAFRLLDAHGDALRTGYQLDSQ